MTEGYVFIEIEQSHIGFKFGGCSSIDIYEEYGLPVLDITSINGISIRIMYNHHYDAEKDRHNIKNAFRKGEGKVIIEDGFFYDAY